MPASPDTPTKAVILARGLGTRMRKSDAVAVIDPAQSAAADTGVKAMIPVGRPFLDFLLSALADAGWTDVCLVIGPEHRQVRDHYGRDHPPSRVTIEFAVQEKPLGTADAVLAAENFAGGDSFLVLNSDNYYPVAALRTLRAAPAPAVAGFERNALMQHGNVRADRVTRFGALKIDSDGFLVRILPRTDEEMERSGEAVYASMNCWHFSPDIFPACREVAPSARGELELPQAVQLAIDRQGARFTVVRVAEPVLDLSSRGDIEHVTERLRTVEVSL